MTLYHQLLSKTLEENQLAERAAELGARIMTGLQQTLGEHKAVKAIRGKGLMIGIEVDRPCSDLVKEALDQGLLISVQADKVIRLLPALVISDKEADMIVERVAALILGFINK